MGVYGFHRDHLTCVLQKWDSTTNKRSPARSLSLVTVQKRLGEHHNIPQPPFPVDFGAATDFRPLTEAGRWAFRRVRAKRCPGSGRSLDRIVTSPRIRPRTSCTSLIVGAEAGLTALLDKATPKEIF